MSVLDVHYEMRRGPVSDWVFTHGAAAALIGCTAFWSVVGVTVYFIL
jgi:hypothetical protein